MAISEFHWRDGWYFTRIEAGAVRVQHRTLTSHGEIVRESLIIPASEWASIVASVTTSGEATTYQAAVELHAR